MNVDVAPAKHSVTVFSDGTEISCSRFIHSTDVLMVMVHISPRAPNCDQLGKYGVGRSPGRRILPCPRQFSKCPRHAM